MNRNSDLPAWHKESMSDEDAEMIKDPIVLEAYERFVDRIAEKMRGKLQQDNAPRDVRGWCDFAEMAVYRARIQYRGFAIPLIAFDHLALEDDRFKPPYAGPRKGVAGKYHLLHYRPDVKPEPKPEPERTSVLKRPSLDDVRYPGLDFRADGPKAVISQPDLPKKVKKAKKVVVVSNPAWMGHYVIGVAKSPLVFLNWMNRHDPYRSYKLEFTYETPYPQDLASIAKKVLKAENSWVACELDDVKDAIKAAENTWKAPDIAS